MRESELRPTIGCAAWDKITERNQVILDILYDEEGKISLVWLNCYATVDDREPGVRTFEEIDPPVLN